MATTAITMADRITAAYNVVINGSDKQAGDWIKLADLRELLGWNADRNTVDDTLIEMCRTRMAILIPETIQQHLTQADRDAAVDMGNQWKHLLRIG